MKNYIAILLFINVAVFAYGILNARTELPDWREDFASVEKSIDRLDAKTPSEQFQISIFRTGLGRVKSSSSIVINEYKAYESHCVLTMFNIIVLFLMLFGRKAKTETGETGQATN